MKVYLLLLLLIASIVFAGQIAVDLGPVQESDGDWLQYDDGTPSWLTWGGMFRGVWFDYLDFTPTAPNCAIMQTEYWFYHHASYPWDTSDVYVEVWDGAVSGPTTQLDQTLLTAIHYSPVFAQYSSLLITANTEFWAFANTELSAGGWPASLGDGTPGTHSFFSDDFIVWEPWGDMGDYMVRVESLPVSLSRGTWGSLKTIF